jgi:regulator of replication initiation timing
MDKIKEKLDNLLSENMHLSLEPKEIRDMLVQQILNVVQGVNIKKPTATVLTEAASTFDPKEHGGKGARPQGI